MRRDGGSVAVVDRHHVDHWAQERPEIVVNCFSANTTVVVSYSKSSMVASGFGMS